jgi:hypothetical protein
MNHRIGSTVFGFAVGLVVAYLAYQWVSDPNRRVESDEQDKVVETSRVVLKNKLAIGDIELVDPLAPQRKVGKVYIYPVPDGWEVSGYYRRNEDDRWHPYLLTLSSELTLVYLKVQDAEPGLASMSETDPLFETSR